MKHKILVILILILVGIGLTWLYLPESGASFAKGEVRAAIDIGSGGTTLKVAKVDPKTSKIISQIFEKSITVPYQKHLEQSSNETFDPEVKEMGIKAIATLKELADQHGAKKVVAVATAAFRKAKNAPEFAREIKEKTGVLVRIIDQDEEGILAFRAALATTSVQPEQAITWDIGGGSMQLTTLTKEGTYLVDKGATASIPFRNAVIEQVEHKDLKAIQTPNPMSLEEMKGAMDLAATYAQSVHPFIKAKMQEPKTEVLAVGNLFYYGVQSLVKTPDVKRSALESVTLAMAGKTDAQLPGGALADITASNPLLVLGYMQGLNLDEVKVISVNNADGALAYPAYWQ